MTPIDPLGQNIGVERAFFVGRRGINLPPCPMFGLDYHRCLGVMDLRDSARQRQTFAFGC